MGIGQQRCRVTIRQPAGTQDETGQPSGSPVDVATVYASIKYQTGAEAVRGGAVTSNAKASIRICRRAGVTSAMEVVYGSTVFKILSVLPDEQDKRYMFLVSEVIA